MSSCWWRRTATPARGQRVVQTGPVQGTDIVITGGLAEGELIAAAGSFKLREGLLVQMTNPAEGGEPSLVH